MARLRGAPAWGVLGAAVLAYELLAPVDELLSAACARALEKHPVMTRAAIILTAAHLLRLIPERVDPFAQLASFKPSVSPGG